jgi:predicted ATPase
LRRLLEYLVDKSLEGKDDEVKQYSIATEVLGRSERFDPRMDTIVRVQARRLRARLHHYYEGEGRDDPIQVKIPAGAYHVRCEVVAAVHARADAEGNSLPKTLPLLAEPIRRVVRRPPPLPAPRTPFIGREDVIAILNKRLQIPETRLLTITGTGGSGKTRLALQLASNLADQFSGGVYFIPLAGLSNPATLDSALANVMGVLQTWGKSPSEALEGYFREFVHLPTLLLLDNFEHILPAASLIARLLDACPALTVLVTSRAVLHVYGEHEYPLAPLAVPDRNQFRSIEDLSQNAAMRLFVQRAIAANPAFALSVRNAWIIAEICCRLDGLPLALELAAPRLKVLSPADLLDRLQTRLELLTNGATDLPARQQTLRRTIDWSHELLSEAEYRLFRRLSVFSGGFTLEGAEAVCNTAQDLCMDLLGGLVSLVDKSLLHEVHVEGAVARFGMLETIREYGLEQLRKSGEMEKTTRAHAAFFLVIAEEGNPQLTPAQRSNWLALCDVEHDNGTCQQE